MSETWICPLGTKIKLKYGTTCTDYPQCGDTLNINGEFYQKQKQQKEDKGLGISEISDESKHTDS